jgi:hypothetical protein
MNVCGFSGGITAGQFGAMPHIKFKILPNYQSGLKNIFGMYKRLATSFNFLYFAPHNFDLKFRHCVA